MIVCRNNAHVEKTYGYERNEQGVGMVRNDETQAHVG